MQTHTHTHTNWLFLLNRNWNIKGHLIKPYINIKQTKNNFIKMTEHDGNKTSMATRMGFKWTHKSACMEYIFMFHIYNKRLRLHTMHTQKYINISINDTKLECKHFVLEICHAYLKKKKKRSSACKVMQKCKKECHYKKGYVRKDWREATKNKKAPVFITIEKAIEENHWHMHFNTTNCLQPSSHPLPPARKSNKS